MNTKSLYKFFALEIVLAGLIMLFDVVTGFGLIALGLFAFWVLKRYENDRSSVPNLVRRTLDAWFDDALDQTVPVLTGHSKIPDGPLYEGGKTTTEIAVEKDKTRAHDAVTYLKSKESIPLWQLACLMAETPMRENPTGEASANLHNLKIKIIDDKVVPTKEWSYLDLEAELKFRRTNPNIPMSADSRDRYLAKISNNTEVSRETALNIFRDESPVRL